MTVLIVLGSVAATSNAVEQPGLERFELPIVADASVVDFAGERGLNFGGDQRVRIKGIEHFWLGKVDARALRGYAVERADLFFTRAGTPLGTFVDASVSVDWQEGPAAIENGDRGVSFLSPRGDARAWSAAAGDFLSVTFGEGGSIRAPRSKRTVPAGLGRYRLTLNADVVQAQILDSFGIAIADAQGQVLGNKDVWAREVFIPWFRPVLVVHARPEQSAPPSAPSFTTSSDPLDSNRIWIEVVAPRDDGADGRAFGYAITVGDDFQVPRWQLPRPGAAGEIQRFPISVPQSWVGEQISISLRAYDRVGHRSPAVVQRIGLAEPHPGFEVDWLGVIARRAFVAGDSFVVSASPIKHSPTIEFAAPGLPQDGANKLRFQVARNELRCFEVLLSGTAESSLRVDPIERDGIAIDWSNFHIAKTWYVQDGANWVGANLLPLSNGSLITIPDPENGVVDQKSQSVWIEFFVPHDAEPGAYSARLHIGTHVVDIAIDILPLTLPEDPFPIEINGYGQIPGFDVDVDSKAYVEVLHDTHRLARRHRATVNLVPYRQSGTLVGKGAAPRIAMVGGELQAVDWSHYEQRYDDLFTGDAFTAKNRYLGPGAGRPVGHAYLPVHENWPLPIEEHYLGRVDFGNSEQSFRQALAQHANEAPPIEQAWNDRYAAALQRTAKLFAGHAERAGWHHTQFQFYLNNKYTWKQHAVWAAYDDAPGSSYWALDEPRDRIDFQALRWFHEQFRAGVAQADVKNVRFANRADVSRPQYDWRTLDQVIDVYTVSSAFFRYRNLLSERTRRVGGETWLYGGGPGVSAGPSGYRALAVYAWLLGADGWLPTYTGFAGKAGWDAPERLALILSGVPLGISSPLPSLRLKGVMQGAQDVGYLTLLSERHGRPFVARWAAGFLGIKGVIDSGDADTPGEFCFQDLKPERLDDLIATVQHALLSNTPIE
ncbi:MAG: hypothetical protein AAF384_07875 [Pseudomonadota bacterium]